MKAKLVTVPDIGQVEFVKRRSQKTIRITLKSDKVRVSMPYGVPLLAAKSYLISKKSWVLKHHRPQILLNDGMHIGKNHRLVIDPGRQRSRVTKTTILVDDDQTKIQIAVKKALKMQAETLLPQRLELLAKNAGVNPSAVKFRDMKSRWGSCSSNRVITLNILLMQLPWDLIDYVIYHELSHLKHMNHSQSFWAFLAELQPNYQASRKLIKQYNPQIIAT